MYIAMNIITSKSNEQHVLQVENEQGITQLISNMTGEPVAKIIRLMDVDGIMRFLIEGRPFVIQVELV